MSSRPYIVQPSLVAWAWSVLTLQPSPIVCRYLVLEHVSGGELFDYLVRKGRLTEKEVIVNGVLVSTHLTTVHCFHSDT